MNTPATPGLDAAPPARLAVCGWNEEAAEALAALEMTGAFAGCAVGDRSGAALVRARRETHLPCFQHVSEMVRAAEYEAILFADSDELAAGALVAAARGAHLLVLATHTNGEALVSAAEAARLNGVPLTLLQPALHDAGVADLVEMLGADGAHYLDVTVEAPADLSALLRIAAGHLATMLGAADVCVRGAAWAEPRRACMAEVQAGDRLASVRVRHAPAALLRIAADGPAGTAELLIRDGLAEVRFTSPAGDDLRYRAEAADPWALESHRAADADRHDDGARAEAQGMLLDAIERAIATGEEQVTACCRRPNLRLLEGGGRVDGGRRRALRLVVS